jgi:hypothetical protein
MPNISHFKTYGKFEIQFPKNDLSQDEMKKLKRAFWVNVQNVADIKNEFGIYIFYRLHMPKWTPLYVGKAEGKKGFEQEVFAPSKLLKYYEAIFSKKHKKTGKYGFFFLVLDRTLSSGKKGKVKDYNRKAIGELETYLIHQGYIKNPDILNYHQTEINMPVWEIDGEKGQGNKSKQFKDFRSIFQD